MTLANRNSQPLTRQFVMFLQQQYHAVEHHNVDLWVAQTLCDFLIGALGGATNLQSGPGHLRRWCPGAVTVIGLHRTASLDQASDWNAIVGHVLDRDDLHQASFTHPGSVIWPTVLSLGEELDATGAEVVRAAVIGYEAMVRLALALGPEHRRLHHVTSTAGVLGATVAAAILYGLGDEEIVSAMGHATSVSGGLTQHFIEHSGTGSFHRANAVRVALMASEWAQLGLRGDQFSFEGERGLFSSMTSMPHLVHLFQESNRWALEEVSMRKYATNGFAQAAVEAALEIGSITLKEVVEIQIAAPLSVVTNASGHHPPQSVEQAWWSMPYAVAVCLVSGNAESLMNPQLVHDPKVHRAMRIIDVVLSEPSTSTGFDTTVRVCFRNGSVMTATCIEPRGHPHNPFRPTDWIEKAKSVHSGLDGATALELLTLCQGLSQHTIRQFMQKVRQLSAEV